MLRDTIEALRIGQSPTIGSVVIFFTRANFKMIMAKILALKKIGRHTFPLVILLTAGISALAQTAAKPQASPAQTTDAGIHVSEKLVDSSLDDDPTVTKMVAVYSPKVRALDAALGRLTGELKKGGVGS